MKNTLLITALLFSLKSYSQTIPAYVPSDNLVGWWPFNGNANDESGNGNNGTVNGSTLITDRSGNSNSAYNFDGVNDYIYFQNVLNLPTTGVMSISAWFKQTQSFGNIEFICQGSTSSTSWGLITELGGYTALNYGRGCSGTGGTNLSNSITDNLWHHIIAVSSGMGGNTEIYIDGVKISEHTNNNSNSCSTSDLYLGIDIFSSPEYINGALDDIGIWNRALTECEIQQLYNGILANTTIDKTISQTGNTLTANQTGATYKWLDCDNGDTEISGETNQSFSPSISGNYKVEITLTDGACIKVDSSDCYSFTFLGLEDTKNNLFNVYPNPTKEILTIELKQFQKTQYTITDQLGKVIKIGDISAKKQSVDVSSFSNGIYFIKIAEVTHKFVKE